MFMVNVGKYTVYHAWILWECLFPPQVCHPGPNRKGLSSSPTIFRRRAVKLRGCILTTHDGFSNILLIFTPKVFWGKKAWGGRGYPEVLWKNTFATKTNSWRAMSFTAEPHGLTKQPNAFSRWLCLVFSAMCPYVVFVCFWYMTKDVPFIAKCWELPPNHWDVRWWVLLGIPGKSNELRSVFGSMTRYFVVAWLEDFSYHSTQLPDTYYSCRRMSFSGGLAIWQIDWKIEREIPVLPSTSRHVYSECI